MTPRVQRGSASWRLAKSDRDRWRNRAVRRHRQSKFKAVMTGYQVASSYTLWKLTHSGLPVLKQNEGLAGSVYSSGSTAVRRPRQSPRGPDASNAASS